ncbi:hypothetical protein JKF63_05001 [Porcisia hertigi]|uniref:Protein kinase domain-containing protein n=1 Tax=Porcisia hertigi TaxID=2761500 RepID=A0A836I6P8_9TRYP|nr:hypothetical protein JKF63_05001 [Porcisia hertigi]
MATVDTVKGRYSSYKLLNEVGRGGSALVYRAQDVVTRKNVAVKQLFGNQPQDIEDWLREVEALHTLKTHRCPHVVEYLDHMQQHNRLFLVEELTEHGSLLRRLKKDSKLTEGVACHYIFQVLTALYHMEPCGVVHGDIKASNVLLFDGDVVKLTDFALRSHGEDEREDAEPRATAARTPSSEPSPTTRGSRVGRGATDEGAGSTPSQFRGSAYWAAPEVLAGASRATPASDIWSVGCLAVELLTGSPPYFDRTVHNAIHHLLKKYYSVLSESEASHGDDEGQHGPRRKKNGANEGDGASSLAADTKKTTVTTSTQGLGKDGVPVAKTTASSSTVGALDQYEAAVPPCETTLLPPLPDYLCVSDECMSFLRMCFRCRAADRPSAGELLHHPWFLNCAVPQLLRAVREGRGINTTAGEESGTGDRFGVIEQWVERNLTCDSEDHCKSWLNSDALPLLVPVLTPRIMTPKYIGNVMRCFSRFSEARSALATLFLNRLGSTELWGVEELTSACDSDDLATLFRRCCAVQDAQVSVYTPTDPRALHFVLDLEKEKVAACVRALHSRLVLEPTVMPITPSSPTAVAGDTAVELNNHPPSSCCAAAPVHKASDYAPPSLQEQHEQQRRARERLLRDGGAAVLCQWVEEQCKATFLGNTAPRLEWCTMNSLLDVLLTIEPLVGGKALLWGLGPEANGGRSPTSATVGAGSASGAAIAKPMTVVATPRGGRGGNEMNDAWNKSSSVTGVPSLVPKVSMSPRDSMPATAAVAGGGNVLLSATGSTILGHHADNGLPPEPVHWVTSMSWLLAVQEAARHLCEAAVCLLTRYIPVARESKAEYLEKAGVSLAATLLLVASSEVVSTEVRCAAVESVPQLQASSLHAARYLRDPVRCIPLLALTLKRSYGVPALTSCLLTVITTLTAEKQMLAACTGCSWVWEALVSLLGEVEATADNAAGGNHSCSVSCSVVSNDVSPSFGADTSTASPCGVPEPTAVESSSTQGCSRSRSSGSAMATFTEIVALLSHWFAEVSPTVLLSSAATATTASGGITDPSHLTAPLPLPVLLQTLHRQLVALSQNSRVCHRDVVPGVTKALRHLAPLEAAASACQGYGYA